jgi:hypothetical protein
MPAPVAALAAATTAKVIFFDMVLISDICVALSFLLFFFSVSILILL